MEKSMNIKTFTRWQLAKFLASPPFFIMMAFMVVEALLIATTTWLVINAGRHVANDEFLTADLVWIFCAQSASYIIGTISWIFAERAGSRAFGMYMLRFARENRTKVKLLHDKPTRETIEPFLTGETFQTLFTLISELEFALKLFLSLVFNSIVLGSEIDISLPFAYVAVFGAVLILQWMLQNPVSRAYLENQRMNNRITAHGYTAWENVFSGNRYNLGLWFNIFKRRVREGLRAQIRAILTREGLSASSGIIGLAIVFSTMIYVATQNADDTELLIALATTLPRQIEMTYEVHLLASGWNDLLSVWTRMGGIANNMLPQPDTGFDDRIKFDRLVLKQGGSAKTCATLPDALSLVLSQPTGRIQVRGGNGSGKSTLLASLKTEIKNRAYYWPTNDRLSFKFADMERKDEVENSDEEEDPEQMSAAEIKKSGFSSGERQLKSLREIVTYTDAAIYLLDEWDANLDAENRAAADALVEQLASRARVVEISHREQPA
jgi:ABC-type transport system involved in cytochrome c biogenesis ATPase subunit